MRLPLVTALLAAAALTSSAGAAAPRPQITDPKGDQLPVAAAGYDVVSALFGTEGTTSKVGRKTYYTPSKLVVTVTYAGAVPEDDYAAQVVEFNLPTCAGVYLESYAGGTYGAADCLEDSFDFTVKKSGSTVTFVLPFGVVGKQHFKKGTKLTDLVTYTAYADPVLGYETRELGGDTGLGAVDSATTTAAYPIP